MIQWEPIPLCDRFTACIADVAVPLRAATLLKSWLGLGLIGQIRSGHGS